MSSEAHLRFTEGDTAVLMPPAEDGNSIAYYRGTTVTVLDVIDEDEPLIESTDVKTVDYQIRLPDGTVKIVPETILERN